MSRRPASCGTGDLREQPLVYRRARLEALLKRAKCNLIRFSEAFPDPSALLAECARLGLEGIVAMRRDAPYRSGTRSGLIKVKALGRPRTSTALSSLKSHSSALWV